MTAVQKMSCTKHGSTWTTAAEAHLELKSDVATVDMTQAPEQQLTPKFAGNFVVSESLEDQTLVLTRTWDLREDYDSYKSAIAGIEEYTNDELAKLGWDFSETIE